MKMTLTNVGILAGALAIGYVLYRASQTSAAMQSLSQPVYGSQWDSWQPAKGGTLYV